MFNESDNDGVRDWVCCGSKKKLYSFIKYCILPSIQVTRTIGLMNGGVIFGVFDYDLTITMMENSKAKNYEKHMEIFKKWYDEVDIMEKEDAPFTSIRKFIHKLCEAVRPEEGIFLDLDLFENIKSVGKTLIEDYEEDGMLGILETEMEMKKDEILALFDHINDNKFMMKKIDEFLCDRLH